MTISHSIVLYKQIEVIINMMRPYNATPIFLAVLIGFATGESGLTWQLIVGLAVVAMLHSYATLTNDILDMDIDVLNKRESALIRGSISKRQVRSINFWLLIASLVGIASLRNYMVTAVVLVATALSWAYNYKPLRLSFRPLGSMLTLGLLYGFLPLLFGAYIAGAKLSGAIFLLAIVWFLQRCSVSMLKDYKDKAGDKKYGKKTFLIAYSDRVTAITTVTLATLGYFVLATYMFMQAQDLRQNILYAVICAGMLCAIWIRTRLIFAQDNKQRILIGRKAFVFQNVLDLGVLLWFII